MANHLRIIFDVFSEQPEPFHSFLGTLIAAGWYAHVPVPDRNLAPDERGDRGIGAEIRAWGGYLFPDMRILTAAGKVEVCEPGRNLPHFAAESIEDRIAALGREQQPGFIPPKPTDHMASFIAESRGGIPWKFFQTVIDDYYDHGLRFFFLAYDLGDSFYGDVHGRLFYSVPADFECDTDPLDGRSIHCIALTVPDYVKADGYKDMPSGDIGDDLYADLPEPTESDGEDDLAALAGPDSETAGEPVEQPVEPTKAELPTNDERGTDDQNAGRIPRTGGPKE